jgi:hypothetical protein
MEYEGYNEYLQIHTWVWNYIKMDEDGEDDDGDDED